MRHRKFQDGEWADLQLALQRDPARPAYKLGIRYESPGIFYLGFVLRNTPQRENFSVLPSGFYYRKKVSLTCACLLQSAGTGHTYRLHIFTFPVSEKFNMSMSNCLAGDVLKLC